MHSCSDNNIDPDFLVPDMFWCFIEKNMEGFQNFSILFNPEQLRIYFFKPYFHYCSSSAHYCEGHFHSHLYLQFKYMTFICS